MSQPRPSGVRGVLRIVLAYLLFALIWIVIANGLLDISVITTDRLASWHLISNLLFVALTSGLLLLLLRRLVREQATTDERFMNVAEQARDILVICDRTLHIAYANPAFQALTGYTAAELEGMHVVELLADDHVARFAAHVEALQTTAYLRETCVIVGKTGRRCHLETTSQRLTDGRYLAIGTEVNEVLVARKAAELERQRLDVLLRSIPDPVWLQDAGGVYLACNPALERFLGRPAGQIIGHAAGELCSPEMAEECATSDRIVAETRQQITRHQSFPAPDGSTACFVTTKCPVLDADGRLTAIFGIARDVTAERKAHIELAASAELNRAILDATTAQVAVIDRNGDLIAVNAAWSRFATEHSCEASQEARSGLGSNFFNVCCQDCHTDIDQAHVAAAGVRAVVNGETERFSMESKCATPEQTLCFLMNVTPLKTGAGGAVITYLDITGIKAAQETQVRYSQQLQALARKHQDIEEKERLRLSMELHDQIGQSLAALKISLAQTRRQLAGNPAGETVLEQALDIVDSVARTTHDISHRLRPPLLDELGVKSALSWHIGNLPCPENVRVHFEADIGAARFPESVELACFRIVQEALNNALRHAEPNEIRVRIYSTPEHLCLAVQDDGRGFNVDIPMQQNEKWISLGLIGIRERIAQLGGSLRIDSKPNAGTQVSACLPKEIPA